ncbi:HK97-gp10 family putative phage morphogenesis protein [Faecalibaculum rodentium]|uniref:HK97-gp10 family putative phage morphogenesis protein n=2 Tax=Erysipelotrichaceae TaxID=128827 RepID=UPI0025B785CA|nr:HK97-gp10 family putative phage morphogenesis protein [Faecalibaculum rodentium]
MRLKVKMKIPKNFMTPVNKGKIARIVQLNTAELTRKAKANAPYPCPSHPYSTGQLQGSILPEIANGGMTGKVAATAEYAEYVEMGTRFMAAQPYMKPAFDQQKEVFLDDMKKLIMKEL